MCDDAQLCVITYVVIVLPVYLIGFACSSVESEAILLILSLRILNVGYEILGIYSSKEQSLCS